jgi:hypothetical protein
MIAGADGRMRFSTHIKGDTGAARLELDSYGCPVFFCALCFATGGRGAELETWIEKQIMAWRGAQQNGVQKRVWTYEAGDCG